MKEKSEDKVQDLPARRIRLPSQPTTREAARAKLRNAGVLAADLVLPADLTSATDEELDQLGTMRSGARPSEELVAEDRGAY